MKTIFEEKKKRKKIIFENIDANPEALSLATPFSLISLMTGFQGFLLLHVAYIFTFFSVLTYICQCFLFWRKFPSYIALKLSFLYFMHARFCLLHIYILHNDVLLISEDTGGYCIPT